MCKTRAGRTRPGPDAGARNKSFLLLFFKKEGLACFLLLISPAKAATLSAIQARNSLTCAVVTEAADWNREDGHGDLTPLATEICRAVTVAVFGASGRLHVLRVPSEAEALAVLRAGQADLAVGVTPALSTGLRLGITYGPPVFWDVQAVLVDPKAGIGTLAGLAGKPVCFLDGTEAGAVLLAAVKARGIAMRPFPFQEEGEMAAALAGGRCRAMSAMASRLADARVQLGSLRDFALLPDRLAAAPAAVATRAGDPAWSAVVAATVDVLVQAEMVGVTQASVAAAARQDADPVLARLLGRDWSSGLALGLAHDWSARVIGAVGNYGEIYGRTLGEGSPRRLPAGMNQDCWHGGALCAGDIR